MATLAELAAALGLDGERARVALGDDGRGAAAAPWYVQGIIGLGAWIAGIAIVALAGLFIALTVGEDQPLAFAVVGAAAYAAGLAGLSGRRALFAAHAFASLAWAGTILAALGIAMFVGDAGDAGLAAGAVVATLLAALTVHLARDPILQFLTTAVAAGWMIAWLGAIQAPFVLDILAIASVLGAALTLRPPVARDMRPAATVLLLVLPVSSILLYSGGADLLSYGPSAGGLVASAALAVLLVVVLWAFARARPRPAAAGWLPIAGGAAALVAILLPPGGAAALLLLVLAFVVGSHALAVLGALLEAYFLWRLYYDLAITLLEKSLILVVVGIVLLALYAWLERQGRVPRAPS